jgi:hypothetical protein
MEHILEENKVATFAKKVSGISRIMSSSSVFWYMIAKVYLNTGIIAASHSKNLKTLRNIAENCNPTKETCDPCKCSERSMNLAKSVRDDFIDLKERCEPIKYFAALTPVLDNIIIDWDDFVVDLTISQSSELNDALTLLSDAI